MARKEGNTEMKLRNTKVSYGITYSKNNGMSPPGISRIYMEAIASTLAKSKGITQPLEVGGVFEFLGLK